MRSSSLASILFIASTSAFSPQPPNTSSGITRTPSSARSSFPSRSTIPTTRTHTILNSSSSTLSSSSSSSATETTNLNDNELEFDWRTITQELFQTDKRPIVLFDGVCNLCNGGVNFALDNDSIGNLRFASLQSKAGQALLLRSGKNPTDISSIVLVTSQEAHFKSDAVLRIAKELDGNPMLPIAGNLGPFLPRFARNIVYDFVAKNRYRFGEADQCRLDFDNEFGSRFVSDNL
mmetsp:Transcript_2538/g.3906  ORF Transcript_2538/g.3906 Transcript_2538/m.3906 type:complete len:234 (-) Transcript_2538:378-1079(-)